MNVHQKSEIYTYRVEKAGTEELTDADPITTQVVRAALNSAANQMKNTLIRTAFSPIIYEAQDFAVALYDSNIRMLSQAPTLPAFMGTMNFCVEAAVSSVGGADCLEPGDIIIYNEPYGTGSHAQDVALVAPVFLNDDLIGYACNKAHWLDIGAKSTYCTDTTDVFQEGVVIPGFKICRRGEIQADILKFITANCRMPDEVEGDLNAQITSNQIGAKELTRVVERFGRQTFDSAVQHMFAHGEAITRKTLERIPDGRYVARGQLDDNGVDDGVVPFEIVIEVKGSNIMADFTGAPDASRGPINCPFPSTVSMVRIALSSIVGAGEAPNEGHFRPIEIKTRPGSMFHPVSPQPCYLYGWAIMPAMEAINEALCHAAPELVPSGSAGDIASVQFWGYRETEGSAFMWGSSLPVGQGAHIRGDGATMYIPSLAFSRLASAEITEAKVPVRMEKWEYVCNSAGPGKNRGGLGWSFHWTALTDGLIISSVEQTLSPAFGQQGGGEGKPNYLEVAFPDGTVKQMGKVTDYPLPKGATVRIDAGGGGGFGDPAERSAEAVLKDLREGLITEEAARTQYPHVFS